jgi:hypothetical protein
VDEVELNEHARVIKTTYRLKRPLVARCLATGEVETLPAGEMVRQDATAGLLRGQMSTLIKGEVSGE